MGVYIKSMEMPKNCAWCRFLQSTNPIPKRELFCGIDTTNNIHDYKPDKGCPLVPVPPRGRLVDADALRAEVKKHATPSDAWVFSLIRTAPTILEAEEGE